MNPDVWMEKSKDISDDMPDGEMMPSSSVDVSTQNGTATKWPPFPDDIFKCIFFNENV